MAIAEHFTALVLEEADGKVTAAVQELDEESLPEGEVTVAVAYSTVNYKDGMILGGIGRLVKTYPHIPGIDFAGTVESSTSPAFRPGDPVILTGWRVGEVRWGGYATRARVKADWLVPLPAGLSLRQSMAIGTAGLSAMLALMSLEEHGLSPYDEGEVLVTGAAGGVGSIAVALLSALGYRVAVATGRAEAHDYLRELGATVIVGRDELARGPQRPLETARWSGAIDNVGGVPLATVLAGLRPQGSCAAVGNAAGPAFPGSVLPFILRGVNLLGIDSAFCPLERRVAAWRRLASELPLDRLEWMTQSVPLAEVANRGADVLAGRVRGRTLVEVRA
ncbi:MDR family oxidoreductase [Shumkonia mesophila]|uniref:MDR family oxidoreductase n=1 Tax=Shumkonia mesophila TaxID=2838854 RepID=UPI002934AD71|nr:MDR family oxidoreductase [Shumkonia mesophila]